MSQMQIVSIIGFDGMNVPAKALEAIGLKIGDKVHVTLGDGQLILRPAANSSRQQQIDEITTDVFARRKSAYERLA